MQPPAPEQQVEQEVGAGGAEAGSACYCNSSSSSSSGETAGARDSDVARSTASAGAVDVAQLLPGLPPAALAGARATLVDSRRVALGARLGSGASASVFAAQLEGSSSRLVVKRLHRAVEGAGRQAANEVAMLLRAGRHPSLVAWHGWWVDAAGRLCLLLQRCEGGALEGLLKAHDGGAEQGLFSEGMVMAWFVQLLLGLHHLHRRRILHRDLKPDNVLLSANKRVASLADLGTSKALAGHGALAATCAGTPQFAAPEVLACRPYSYAADIWSLGVLLYEMTARRPAHDARGLSQLVVKVLRGTYTPLPPSVSLPLKKLVGWLLHPDPAQRPSTAELLRCGFVQRHMQQLLLALGTAPPQPRPPSCNAGDAAGGGGAEGVARQRSNELQQAAGDAAAAVAADTGIASGGGSPDGSQSGGSKVVLSCGVSLAPQAVAHALQRMAAAPVQGGSSAAPTGTGRSSIATAAAAAPMLPAPVVAPGTRRPAVQAWNTSAAWEAQQQQQAVARYQARALEQRATRERAAQVRRERSAGAAAQQQEQQCGTAPAVDSSGAALSAEASALAAAQDAQLQLLLQQLGCYSSGCAGEEGNEDGGLAAEGLDADAAGSDDDTAAQELEAAGSADGAGRQAAARAWQLAIASLEGSTAAAAPGCDAAPAQQPSSGDEWGGEALLPCVAETHSSSGGSSLGDADCQHQQQQLVQLEAQLQAALAAGDAAASHAVMDAIYQTSLSSASRQAHSSAAAGAGAMRHMLRSARRARAAAAEQVRAARAGDSGAGCTALGGGAATAAQPSGGSCSVPRSTDVTGAAQGGGRMPARGVNHSSSSSSTRKGVSGVPRLAVLGGQPGGGLPAPAAPSVLASAAKATPRADSALQVLRAALPSAGNRPSTRPRTAGSSGAVRQQAAAAAAAGGDVGAVAAGGRPRASSASRGPAGGSRG